MSDIRQINGPFSNIVRKNLGMSPWIQAAEKIDRPPSFSR